MSAVAAAPTLLKMQEPSPPTEPRPQFKRAAFKFLGDENMIHTVEPPEGSGMTIDDLKQSATWTARIQEFKPFDLISVKSVEGGWWALVLMVDALNGQCLPKVVLSEEGLTRLVDGPARGILDRYEFPRDANGQYDVIRKRDRVRMFPNQFSKLNDAHQAVLNHPTERL